MTSANVNENHADWYLLTEIRSWGFDLLELDCLQADLDGRRRKPNFDFFGCLAQATEIERRRREIIDNIRAATRYLHEKQKQAA